MFRLFGNAGILRGWTWLLSVIIIIIALFTVIFFRLLFTKQIKSKQGAEPKKEAKSKRELSLRISKVPADKSLDALKSHLKSIATEDPAFKESLNTLDLRSVIRIDKQEACAIVTVTTSVLENELLDQLKKANNQLPYDYDCKFYGITPLFEDISGAKVDVVAVPGLASHAIGSWKSPSSNDVWLRDYLPTDVPNIRVLLYGYDTTLLKSDSRQSIEDMGRLFLESLKAFRRGGNTNRRPIIFIGHSLGGLLVKEALVHAHKKATDRANLEVSQACCGLLFFGVPNLGLRNDQLQSIVGGQPNQDLIRNLVVDSDSEPSAFLRRMQADGTLRKTGSKMLMVTEKSATSTGLTAVPDEDNIGFDTDHSGLVKYDSRTRGLYPIVRGRLEMLIQDATRIARQFQDNLTHEQKRLWDNLNDPPYSSFRNSGAVSKPEKGTLQWLVEKSDDFEDRHDNRRLGLDDFTAWRDSSKSECLLVTAPPGSGKSILSNFVLRHLESTPMDNAKIVYYFCNIKNNVASRNATSVLRALIVQLCETQQSLFQTLPSDLTENSSRFRSASLDTLLHYFEKMLRDDTYAQVYCVIDGLDVYHDGMDELTAGLIRAFNTNGEVSGLVRKLFCTSRSDQEILDARGRGSPHKALRCNPKDVDTFVCSRVASLKFSDDTKKVITELLRSKVEHTFLWIEAVIRKLKNMRFSSPNSVKRTIQNSSQDLYGLYTDLVQVAAREEEPSYMRLLVWVVYAKRPLRCDELEEAIAFGPEDTYQSYDEMLAAKPSVTPDEIYQSLGTLVDIVEDKVYLIHQSVKDFFEERQPLQSAFSRISPRLYPAYVSIAYLNLIGTEYQVPHGDTTEQFSLRPYALDYWHTHIETTKDVYDEILLQELHSQADYQPDPMGQGVVETP
ncbi:hypothetical protein F4779DRAFT_616681 [Xylariaceae sp. FL0662B]|nr:hypothetical protein F4779DRAFT_616681 [Xylariaceae sp. FL0662B]